MVIGEIEFVTEAEQVHLDAANDAYQHEEEAQEAYDEGYCIHCGEELEDCTGYKCW
ncbi:uncharacterized protein METZ01_LOCUS484905, partial [marine metagenome]